MPAPDLTPKQLRDYYKKGTLKQRYNIARARVEHPELGPSVLVNAYSALEGFSRAVAVKLLTDSGMELRAAYDYHKNMSVVDLIEKHICPGYRTTPQKLFGKAAWERLPIAAAYRNVLMHEAAFLNGGTCAPILTSLRHCLDRMAELAIKSLTQSKRELEQRDKNGR